MIPQLAPVEQTAEIGPIDVPEDLYWVTHGPPALAGMRDPHESFPWSELESSGIRQVVCLTGSACVVPDPFRVAHVTNLSDLFGGTRPADPVAEEALVHEAADAVVTALATGEGVVAHCLGGRGRTGTVLGVALVKLGADVDEVEFFLRRLHEKRGRPGWPESPWQSEVLRRAAVDIDRRDR